MCFSIILTGPWQGLDRFLADAWFHYSPLVKSDGHLKLWEEKKDHDGKILLPMTIPLFYEEMMSGIFTVHLMVSFKVTGFSWRLPGT